MFASTGPLDYLGPLWYVLGGLVIVAFVLFMVLKPLYRYLTDRKTEKILAEYKDKEPAQEGKPAAADEGGRPPVEEKGAGEKGGQPGKADGKKE